MKSKDRKNATQPRLSQIRRRTFALLALTLPVALLLATEGVLRLLGHGGYDPVLRVAGEVPGGRLILCDQAGAVSYFYANPSRPGYNNQDQFVDPKPAGVFRVFLLGESAAKGYPQPPNLASSAFLRAMLSDAWPDRRVEVINLGTTAVASFPVLGMLKEALEYEPDLILIHTGHNEFFGAYGVNSISRGGTSVAQLKMTRFIRSLALVQALDRLVRSDDAVKGKSLMEIMVGESYTAPDDPIRAAAAANLGANIREMLRLSAERGVPALACTLPSNERDLFPVGADRTDTLPADARARLEPLLASAAALMETNAPAAVALLEEAVSIDPRHARAHFLMGRALFAAGDTNRAQQEFVAARDLDSMPWRATTIQQQAIRQAAASLEMPLCDMEQSFRAHSPGGCIGWELMDDHVHPTLRGQALMAESIVGTLRQMTGAAALSDQAAAHIRSWQEYAAELGDNPWDRYGVDYAMLKLFQVPFVRERNAEGLRRFQARTVDFEAALPAELLAVVREWQSETPHAGGKRPITGMVARQYMREKRYDEALNLYRIAEQSVPEYTSWHMEYVYFALVCREKLTGALTEEERQLALHEIEQGRFLLRRGFSQTGLTERYTGRLHQLRGEWGEAIPYLNASRGKLSGIDLVAADQALFTSLLKTGRQQEARQLAEYGVAHSGQFAPLYQQLLQLLDQESGVSPAPDL